MTVTNLDAPFGFVIARHLAGGIPHRLSQYEISDGFNENIFQGAMVNSVGDGTVKEAAATEAILGLFMGVQWIAADGEPKWDKYWAAGTDIPAGTKAYALVADDPMLTFYAQASGEVLAADQGLFADLNVPATSGNVNTGKSLMEVGAHDGSETQLKILRIVEQTQRNATGGYQLSVAGTNAVVEVMIAKHELTQTAAAES